MSDHTAVLPDGVSVTCQTWKVEVEVRAVLLTRTRNSCVVQGPDAGIHVHSLQNFTAASSAGMSAAPGCQAVAFSPTGELLAVAEAQPSCRLALWDWQQVGHTRCCHVHVGDPSVARISLEKDQTLLCKTNSNKVHGVLSTKQLPFC